MLSRTKSQSHDTIRESFIILYKKNFLRGSFFSISHKEEWPILKIFLLFLFFYILSLLMCRTYVCRVGEFFSSSFHSLATPRSFIRSIHPLL